MNEKEIIEIIENTLKEKIEQEPNFIRYTFYEVRVKYNLSENEKDAFLILMQNKLYNLGYKVYFQGDKYIYGDIETVVQPNELIIAIRELK